MSVRETVLEGMKAAGLGGYEQQAEPVITALEQREVGIFSSLVAYATEQGLDRDTAMRAIVNCGLDAPAMAEAEDPRISQMEAQINALTESLRALRGQG